MKRLICTTVLLVFSITTWALSPKAVTIKKETPEMNLQIKYPQGFADKTINTSISSLIAILQKVHMPKNDEKLANKLPGKNSLFINYKTEFVNDHAVSLLFSISAYTRGAAHPANSVKAVNFINGREVSLDKLFKPNSYYLSKIAELSRAELLKKINADKDWVTTGTQPTEENYKNWVFTKTGLAIVFDTYQVAPYVYGPQRVEIFKTELGNFLRPEIINAVWGSQ